MQLSCRTVCCLEITSPVSACVQRSEMSDFPAAPVDIPCHAVQSESLLRAHSCSPKRFSSALLDVSIHGQLRSENRSPPPDKLDSHRLHIPAIHQENSEAMTFVESSCALQAPQEESSTEDTVITSAEASWSSLGEHRSPEKSMKASLEVEVATSKDEIVVLRQQAAKVRYEPELNNNKPPQLAVYN